MTLGLSNSGRQSNACQDVGPLASRVREISDVLDF